MRFNFEFRCDNSAQPVKCTEGHFVSVDKLSCEICPKGYKCPVEGLDSPLLCSNGTYQNNTGQAACLQCPAGYGCDNLASEPLECSQGQYSLLGMSECLYCPAGFR